MGLQNLPNELLSCIAEALSSEKDINAFVQTNRRTYRTLNPYLYQHNLQQSGSSVLLWAARHGQKKTAANLLRERRNDQAKCDYGTPLCVAAEMGHEEIVKLLLDKGADVNAQGGYNGNALYAASEEGHEAIVKLLLDKDADVNVQSGYYGNPLHAASTRGHATIVKLLLDKGANINAQDGCGGSSLYAASLGGHEAIVKLLLDKGADVNVQSGKYYNALFAASSGGYEAIVKLLLDQGAEVNASNGGYYNALYAASCGGHEAIIKLLLDKGADINAQGGLFGTPLQGTLYEGHETTMKLLLDKGADINVQGGWYGNALSAATVLSRIKLIELLLSRGADPFSQDSHGWTTLMTAFTTGNLEIHSVFQAHSYDLRFGWDQCIPPSALTTRGTSTVSILGGGTVAYSRMSVGISSELLALTSALGQLDSCELDSRVQIRADHPFPIAQRVVYFEITINSVGINRYLTPFSLFCNDNVLNNAD